ncbi:glutathione S-transferase family protein [Limnohabitans sp.]|uniref:glutathione S-transferase family protein n=1 Tax=Limnohabitans sp. TaxID=1907725 RepID=UPI00286F876F|nr:glutathione S-transferase family protein [Limnohabitans sp.]
MTRTLYIGNKNYSSWSMRPWVLMTQVGIPFTEQRVRFDSFEADSHFKQALLGINPVGKVPALVEPALGTQAAIWDSLAICEYLAESYPDLHLWPVDKAARARARSVCAEMHSGLGQLRSHFPMNIEAHLPDVGARLLQEQAGLRTDLQRVVQMWQSALAHSNGPMLFGAFSIADAFFAPVCMRLRSYATPLPADIQAYVDRVVALPSVARWIREALAEKDFLPFEEPYRQAPT